VTSNALRDAARPPARRNHRAPGAPDHRLATCLLPASFDLLLGSGVGTYNGTNCGEVVHGNDAANSIFGNGGEDIIYGYGGNDTIQGGDGDGRLVGGQAVACAGNGCAAVAGEDGSDNISGGSDVAGGNVSAA
jgi:hypothetical protein